MFWKNSRGCGWIVLSVLCVFAAPAVAGNTTVYEYDGMEATLSYVYDSVAGLTFSGRKTEYDVLGRPTRERVYSGSNLATALSPNDSEDSITLHEYDIAGNLTLTVSKGVGQTQLTQYVPGSDVAHAYTYDSLDRQVTATDPVGGRTINLYTPVGDMTTHKVLMEGTTYADTEYTYDCLGRAVTVTDPAGLRQLSYYSSRGAVFKSVAQTSGGVAKSQSRYYYDNAGRQVTSVSFATASDSDGFDVTEDRVAETAYDADGRVLTRTTFNMNSGTPIHSVSQYDGYGRPELVQSPDGQWREKVYLASGLVDTEYAYDGLGTRTFEYRYDDGHRLTLSRSRAALTANDLETSYAYDSIGRQTSTTIPRGLRRGACSIGPVASSRSTKTRLTSIVLRVPSTTALAVCCICWPMTATTRRLRRRRMAMTLLAGRRRLSIPEVRTRLTSSMTLQAGSRRRRSWMVLRLRIRTTPAGRC